MGVTASAAAVSEQLVLGPDLFASVDVATVPRLTAADLGLVEKVGPGGERLVAELLRRGLAHEHVYTAARLAALLEEDAGA